MDEKYNLDTVQFCCLKLAKEHFVEVPIQPNFLYILPQIVVCVLGIQDLTDDSEYNGFHDLESWLAFDVDSGVEYALQLL